MASISSHVQVMVMAGKIRFPFHLRVFLTVLAFCWFLVGVFMILQYHREKEFKQQVLDTRLQMHNQRILEDLSKGEEINHIVNRIGTPIENLRISVVDSLGNLIYDNNANLFVAPATNHNNRPEIIDARRKGVGNSVERLSESDDLHYFYSARLGDNGLIVRTAVPYTHTLTDFLKADSTLLWIMAALTFLMSFVAFVSARKISLSISRLNSFAEKAQKWGNIYDENAFPNDELGNIASNIVHLYYQRDEHYKNSLKNEKDKIRLKKQLTNNINHELKTPVASIMLCLDLLDDHPEMSEDKKQEFMKKIRMNANRLNSLLKDVATITRLDYGKNLIEKEAVELSGLIKEVVEEERLRTDMTINVAVPYLQITGNRSLLETLFRNLIDNAIVYSGGTEINITADDNGNFIVSDNGCGISEEHLPYIFERFYRVDKGRSRAAGGTGLGLSIVKNAVALHGGQIKVESKNGLTYRFNLKVNKNATFS